MTRNIKPTCAHCGVRPATCIDESDGRRVLSCFECRDEATPEPPVPTIGDRAMRMLKISPGLDIATLSSALGDSSEEGKARVCAAVNRLVHAGRVRRDGPKNERIYYPAAARG